ncbi:hypothetical protein RBSWK_02264 [Rhodopirellula baltica SWK14]|uniref:Uncharacterized protein n=1 Tax=Rhodopirellula baltica SWK14 TaxID=993516 RepID=L7CJH3_RHOBT|nr:hypothetical protein RBSWK_02264 [Rhodopirellula baltica SWK14]
MAYAGRLQTAKWTLQMGNCWCLQSLQPRSRNTLQFAIVNLYLAIHVSEQNRVTRWGTTELQST